MNVRISVLCENSVGPMTGTLGEHGFAALVEPRDGAPLLFDTGQGGTLLHNARCLGKDLARLGAVVISHGHYDHGGGLLPLLEAIGPRPVLAHPGIFITRYRVKDTGDSTPIGLPQSRAELEAAGARFDLSTEFREIAPGCYLSGQVPRTSGFETGDRGLYRDCSGQDVDSTLDDQSLVLESDKGLVIVLGCCHAGLVNTIEHVAERLQRRDIYAVIGGTHLGFCSQEQLYRTIAALKGIGIGKLAASHCTGFSAAARLSREMAKEFQPAMVGYTLEA